MSLPTTVQNRNAKKHKIFAMGDVQKHNKSDDMWSQSSPLFSTYAVDLALTWYDAL
jgi:hypothetical protein